MDQYELIGYCGVNCEVCIDYLSHICPGCRKSIWEGEVCNVIKCNQDQHIPFCAKCSQFPCKSMQEFYQESKSHQEAYLYMKELGK